MFSCIKSICNKSICKNSPILRSIGNIRQISKLIQYELIKQLGEGATSVVYKVLNKEEKKFYTCKILSVEKKIEVHREVRVLKKLSGYHFPKFKELFCTEKEMHILTDFIEGEELFKHINNTFLYKNTIDFKKVGQYALEMASIIKTLYSLGFIHLDIKMENFIQLSDDPITLKLIDFGTAHPIIDEMAKTDTTVGTLGYSPLEIYKNHYHPNSDVWSLGIIIWILITRSPPFNHSEIPLEFTDSFPISRFMFPLDHHNELKTLMPQETFDLFCRIFELFPEDRVSIDDILNHKPFAT